MFHCDELNSSDNITDTSQDDWSLSNFGKYGNKQIRSRLGRRKLSSNPPSQRRSEDDLKSKDVSDSFPWSQLSNGNKLGRSTGCGDGAVTHPASSTADMQKRPYLIYRPNQNVLKDIGNNVKESTKIDNVLIVDSSDECSKENIKYILNNSFIAEDSLKTDSGCLVSDLSVTASENKQLYDTLPFKTPVKGFCDDSIKSCTPNPLDGILDPESDSSFDLSDSGARSQFISFNKSDAYKSTLGENASESFERNKCKLTGEHVSPSTGLLVKKGTSDNAPTVSEVELEPFRRFGESKIPLFRDAPLGSVGKQNDSSKQTDNRDCFFGVDKNNKISEVSGSSEEAKKKSSAPTDQLVFHKPLPATAESLFKTECEKESKVQSEIDFPAPESRPVNIEPHTESKAVNVEPNAESKPVNLEPNAESKPLNTEPNAESKSVNIEPRASMQLIPNHNVIKYEPFKNINFLNMKTKVEVNKNVIVDTPLFKSNNPVLKPFQHTPLFANKIDSRPSQNSDQKQPQSTIFSHTSDKTSKPTSLHEIFKSKMAPFGSQIGSTPVKEVRLDFLVPPRVPHQCSDPPKSVELCGAQSQSSIFGAKSVEKVGGSVSRPENCQAPSVDCRLQPFISTKPALERPFSHANPSPLFSNQMANSLSSTSNQIVNPVAGNHPSEVPLRNHNFQTTPARAPQSNVEFNMMTPAKKLGAVKLSPPSSQSSNNKVFKKPFAVPCEKPPPKNLFPKNQSVDLRNPQDILVNGKTYTAFSMLGQGGSSVVYQVMDPKTSKLMAVKCVNLNSVDESIANGYLNEVHLLEKLQGCQSVIKMFDYEYIKENKLLYVVMERGDIDLAKLIKDITKTKKISMTMVMFYWTEMLSAVKDIHDRGIIHSDLKPANFLLVSGRLKLIDFGIASSLQGDMTSVIKDVTTGTFNYMSPEAINTNSDNHRSHKISYKSDVWSLGCILYSLLFGKSPYSHFSHMWSKLKAIVDPSCLPPYPPESEVQIPFVLNLALRWCLIKDPKRRPTVAQLLQLPYCDPPLREERRLRNKAEIYSSIMEMFPDCSFDFL